VLNAVHVSDVPGRRIKCAAGVVTLRRARARAAIRNDCLRNEWRPRSRHAPQEAGLAQTRRGEPGTSARKL